MNTPKARQEWIYNELVEMPTLSHGEMFGKYSVNFGRTEKTFDKDWKVAQERFKSYQNKLQTEKERVSIEEEIKTVKKGLKTKSERLLNLQKLADDCLQELESGQTTETIIVDGVPKAFSRKMTLYEINHTRKVFKELQAEISKIEGDYAVTKVEQKTILEPIVIKRIEKD